MKFKLISATTSKFIYTIAVDYRRRRPIAHSMSSDYSIFGRPLIILEELLQESKRHTLLLEKQLDILQKIAEVPPGAAVTSAVTSVGHSAGHSTANPVVLAPPGEHPNDDSVFEQDTVDDDDDDAMPRKRQRLSTPTARSHARSQKSARRVALGIYGRKTKDDDWSFFQTQKAAAHFLDTTQSTISLVLNDSKKTSLFEVKRA